jgi:hypothetical protein
MGLKTAKIRLNKMLKITEIRKIALNLFTVLNQAFERGIVSNGKAKQIESTIHSVTMGIMQP